MNYTFYEIKIQTNQFITEIIYISCTLFIIIILFMMDNSDKKVIFNTFILVKYNYYANYEYAY